MSDEEIYGENVSVVECESELNPASVQTVVHEVSCVGKIFESRKSIEVSESVNLNESDGPTRPKVMKLFGESNVGCNEEIHEIENVELVEQNMCELDVNRESIKSNSSKNLEDAMEVKSKSIEQVSKIGRQNVKSKSEMDQIRICEIDEEKCELGVNKDSFKSGLDKNTVNVKIVKTGNC